MSRTTLGFIYSSLLSLLLGVTLGALMVLFPDLTQLRPVHTHLNLVGFVSFMVMGIAYHILPRFRGRPLYSEGLAWSQFWLSNVALAGLTLFAITDIYAGWGRGLRGLFAVLLVISFYLFIYNIGRTLIEKPKEGD